MINLGYDRPTFLVPAHLASWLDIRSDPPLRSDQQVTERIVTSSSSDPVPSSERLRLDLRFEGSLRPMSLQPALQVYVLPSPCDIYACPLIEASSLLLYVI